jgi:hypothetical protein
VISFLNALRMFTRATPLALLAALIFFTAIWLYPDSLSSLVDRDESQRLVPHAPSAPNLSGSQFIHKSVSQLGERDHLDDHHEQG